LLSDNNEGAENQNMSARSVRSSPMQLPDRVHELDEAVDKWLEPHRSPALDRLFYGLSSAADHGLIWHAIGALSALEAREPRRALRLSAMLGVESALTNGLVKSFFRRGRPPEHFENDDPLPFGMRRPITSSFPSGHAATAFLAASVLSERGTGRAAYFSLAGLVAFSRVYTRMHHASDVAAGAALGLVLGRLGRGRLSGRG
jgi:membrane-associated phospholipid phosphatase